MEKIVILGAGSWGTALALVVASKGLPVVLWTHNAVHAEIMSRDRENKRLLSGYAFPDNLIVTEKSERLLEDSKLIVFAVPAQSMRAVVKLFSPQINEQHILVSASKGLEVGTGERMSAVIADEILGKYYQNVLSLSGPTHAEEIVRKLPSAIVIAGNLEKATKVYDIFETKHFRVYTHSDIIGVELGGALKNCYAIACGACDGLELGDNTKAALITRALVEMTRFGEFNGADKHTFSGLSGIGDLFVTCASKHSRNRYVGEQLGRGKNISEILQNMVMVAEGVPTIKAAHDLAFKNKIRMPILNAMYSLIYENKSIKEVFSKLLNRSAIAEFE